MLGGGAPRDAFFLVSVPAKDKAADMIHERIRDVAIYYPFKIPGLLVGTQDSLMMLSDELSKLEALADSVTRRVAQQLAELTDNKPELIVKGANPETYLTQFQWEEARYAPKAPLRDTVARIQQQVNKLDEELRAKSLAYNTVARDIEAEKRKEGSSLLTRNLSDDVKAEDFIETDYLTTLFVVVPKSLYKEWKATYERLTEYVLPRSSRLLKEEAEFGLYNVTLFKRVAEDFKNLAREKKFTVRDFTLEQLSDTAKNARMHKETERDTQQKKLTRWCTANFAEAFQASVHLKIIRVFVESVLRYGLPAEFNICLLRVKKDEKKVLLTLGKMFEHLSDKRMLSKGKEEQDQAAVAGAQEEFYAFVFTLFDLDMSRQS